MSVRVFVVDDHPAFRDGLRVALSGDSVTVVGEAESGEDAIVALPGIEPPPDVVLMDVRLSGHSGIEATRRLTGRPGAPRILMVSASSDDDQVIGAIRAGASGFVEKTASRSELLRCVHLVAEGGAVFGPRVAERLSTYFTAIRQLPDRMAFPDLTERETQILDLLARGHDNRGIARELVLAEKTVRNHITHVFMKLDVTDRTAAVVRARDAGLGRNGT